MKQAKMLRVARAALGLSRKDLARMSGVSTATIARIEDGSVCLTETMGKLFGAMPEVLFVPMVDGFTMTYVEMPTEEDYMAALGPCGK